MERLAIANVRGSGSFNPSEEVSHLMYFDINNQYGWSMSECLPTHGIHLLGEEQYDVQGVNGMKWNGKLILYDVFYFYVLKERCYKYHFNNLAYFKNVEVL